MADATEPRFLGVDEVVDLHAALIARFGGDPGLRDRGMLASACAQPAMMAFGAYLHPTVAEQAAAYLFHLVANHPFVDGNKRIGLLACLVFADTNGHDVRGEQREWYELVMRLAAGKMRKEAVAAFVAERLAVRR